MVRTILALQGATMLGFALGAVLIAHFMRQRRPPAGNLAWILAMVLCPYLALPLYLLAGGRKMRAIARGKPPVQLQDGHVAAARPTALEILLEGHRIPPAAPGHRLALCPTGPDRYAALLKLIDSAQHSLYINMYQLSPDPVGLEIVARLARRARDGLTVRLLLDGVGSRHTRRRHLAPLHAAGGRSAYFLPVFRRPLRGRANLRNHRKMAVADGQRAFAGGANIAKEYMAPESDGSEWRDLSFVLEGPAVRHYVRLFRSDWEFATGERLPPGEAPEPALTRGAVVQVVPSGPDVAGDPLSDALLTVAQSARRRLWIFTPYFVPDDAFCRTLALTAHRKVDVRVITPERSDHALADWSGRGFLREIQAAGGTVCFYPRMLHAKAVLMDDKLAILGSANIDMRSLLLNFEAALFVYDPASIRRVGVWMEEVARQSRPAVLRSGGVGELVESLARLVAPQL
jgi:cardiolipin synthase